MKKFCQMKKIDERSVLQRISKQQKELNKSLESQKQLDEVSTLISTLIPDIKIFVALQDNSKQKIPKSAKKVITEFFISLENAANSYNSQFIDNNFIFEYNQICAIITVFMQDDDLIKFIWSVTNKMISQNSSKFSFLQWEDSIKSFFKAHETFSAELLNILTASIPKISFESATLWWNSFVHLILPHFLFFRMKDTPMNQSLEKNLSRNMLQPILDFVFEIMNYKPVVRVFTVDDIDSCFAVLALLNQIIFECFDDARTQQFIHQCSENMFSVSVSPKISDTDCSPFSFYKCIDTTAEDKRAEYSEIINNIREFAPELISGMFVLLLKDIELYAKEQIPSKCGIAVFRFNLVLSVFILNDLKQPETFTISGAFFLVIARFNSPQLYRLFLEYTLIVRDIPTETWRYLTIPCQDKTLLVKQILMEFISHATIACTRAIFGADIKSVFSQKDFETDPITVYSFLYPESSSSVFFAPMKEVDWSYQQFENYIVTMLSVFPTADDIPFIAAFAAALEKIASFSPKTEKSNLARICHRILGLLNPEQLDESGIHAASILISHTSKLTELEKEIWTNYLISQLPKQFAINEIAHVSLTPPVLPYARNMILECAKSITKCGINVNDSNIINVLSSAICFTNVESISSPIFALMHHCLSEENIKSFITFAVMQLLEHDNDDCKKILSESLEKITKAAYFRMLPVIAINKPALFESDEMMENLQHAAERVVNDSKAFEQALLLIQDVCISLQREQFLWKFLDSINTEDERIKQLIDTTKHSVFEASIGLKSGALFKECSSKTTKNKENNLVIERQHLFGTSTIQLSQVKPKEEHIEIEAEVEENEEDETEINNEKEEEIQSIFKSALVKYKSSEHCNASDFKFEKKISEKKQEAIEIKEEQRVETKEDASEANAFNECVKILSGNKQKAKICFKTYNVNIVLSEESEKFNDFSKLLGTKREDGTIHYETYRMEVIFHIKKSLDKCQPSNSYIWEDEGYDASIGKEVFVSLVADLYPLIVVSAPEERGFFQRTVLVKAPTLAKMIQWNQTLA